MSALQIKSMRSGLWWMLGIFLLLSCATTKKTPNYYGPQEYSSLTRDPECIWVRDSLPIVDDSIKALLLKSPLKDCTFKIYLGCWCSDSRRLIPRFRAIAEALSIPPDRMQYLALDLNKKSPSGMEKDDRIEWVPTVIVYQEGKEIGRVVEVAKPNLESVLLGFF
ncbi:MAG: hypothetical protein LPK45_03970 [Bacteroidota bacterium]|nr:hypothetical protein [Bacteroidota bacterium]MDX5430208.1 hypothetical protein [Bacteroidota bacterium]MDX5468970.1 hypothetical protein [Bacteroidota bacterium]